jgi:hypothetical protein
MLIPNLSPLTEKMIKDHNESVKEFKEHQKNKQTKP